MSTGTNKERLITNNDLIDDLIETAQSLPEYLDTTDATATAGDILSGESAYVNGNKLTGTLGTESKTVKSSNVEQTITPTEGKLINEITVEAMELEEVNVTPTTSTQTITPAQGKDGISQVNVGAVTSAIDSNIVAENIKKDVEILGVVGSLESGGGDVSEYFESMIGSGSSDSSGLSKIIKKIPNNITLSGTSASRMFQGCAILTTIPLLNTSNVTDMSYMFSGCYRLTTIPQLNTSSVTNMSSMFSNCNDLTSIPQLNTSSVTNMSSMFSGCTDLTTIPQLDTSNVTNMTYMFSSCRDLTSIPQLDTNKVTSMYGMFSGCSKLSTIPQLDTSRLKTTAMQNMFTGCSRLSNGSLNNILQMCINATLITSATYKKLSYIGLSTNQRATCQTLSNYQAFVDAGWTA